MHFRLFGREFWIGRHGPFDERDRRDLRCSFCGASRESAEKLIAGPRVFICGECAEAGLKLLGAGGESEARGLTRPGLEEGGLRCSFCNLAGKPMAAKGESSRICAGCLEICADILAEDRLMAARRSRD